jgi:hypothetical protein
MGRSDQRRLSLVKEIDMSATYFNRDGSGHSRRGAEARELGAVAWSRLPKALRRGLNSKQAEEARISLEWHHAGKFANRVTVYYPAQVETYWRVLDQAGVQVEEITEYQDLCGRLVVGTGSQRDHEIRGAVNTACNAAEDVRAEITEDE